MYVHVLVMDVVELRWFVSTLFILSITSNLIQVL